MNNKRGGIKLIVFDFDGTLADTYKVWRDVTAKNFKKYGVKNAKREAEKVLVSGVKGKEYLMGLGVSEQDTSRIDKSIYNEVEKKILKVKLCPGFWNVEKLDVKKIVLSNTRTYVIKDILKKNNVKFFSEIYGMDRFKKKAGKIEELKKKYGLGWNEVAYVGDLKKDVKVARDAKVVSIVIAGKCSWSSRAELVKAKPDFLLKSLSEIERLI